jgi:hypothetical protein
MMESTKVRPGRQSSAAGDGCEQAVTQDQGFDWPLANAAEGLLREHIDAFLRQNSFARRLAERMRDETATDFFEWCDHLVLGPGEEKSLLTAGFVREEGVQTPNGETVLEHPRTTLPRVLLRRGIKQSPGAIALRPEFVVDFVARNNVVGEPEGKPFSRYRRIVVSEENGTTLEAVERRAYRGFVCAGHQEGELEAVIKARELWRTRPRRLASAGEGFQAANRLLERILKLVGRDVACHLFFEAEREYWESRNRAGRLQKQRQDQLGLGWGNHDHHTFRGSREHFTDLIEFLSGLGFEKRERFYAGAEAGWGAQVAEQPVAGIVVFADVDLNPEETQVDFSTVKLPPAQQLGTVGLWVGLHGESFLEAGMHHLEARFDFELLREQLRSCGVKTMAPFSDFNFLKQAFTEGERWPVCGERAAGLLGRGQITEEQFGQFMKEGALGSHLENLQRHGGFKGFNQKSVSVVISATDPRRDHFRHAAVAA